MRDFFKDRANDLASSGSRVFKPSLLEIPESRELTQKSVLYLSALLTFGGDESVLILGDAKASSALKVANDVRQLIREQAPQELPDFATSFGICCVDDSSSADDWLERADEALYEAKKQGGDAARMAT